MSRLALAALCAALAACAQPVIQAPPQPPIAQCDAVCWQPCNADGITFAPAPATTDAVGDLTEQVIVPLRGRIDQCEVSRLACQQCIDRLEHAGVIR